MNEITRIHLGREQFTISLEAQRDLKAYLADIQGQVNDKEVINEVELRMAELLHERGFDSEKVVLSDDVDFLQQQLGRPTDFVESGEMPPDSPTAEPATKHLFRDTDNAMLAGVSAGLASYFGLDVVIVRIAFVLLSLASGFGVLLYILLWLLVPPATTSSEKLQMQGKTVTVDALKETVSKADVSAAARRANGVLLPAINTLFGIILKIIGIGFIALGLAVVFGLVVTKTYMMLHHGKLFEENLFPVGAREQWLLLLAMVLAALAAVASVLMGIAVFKRKWPIKAWATAVLAGIFLVGLAASLALSADVGPHVERRYQSAMHTTAVKGIKTFDTVKSTGGIDIAYISAPNYSVNLRYFDHPELSKVKINVVDKTLHIDSTAFDNSRHCSMLCIFPQYNMVVEVTAPNIENFDVPHGTDLFYPRYPEFN